LAGSAGFAASVDAGVAEPPVPEGAGVAEDAPDGVELVVDGSAGLGSLPPQAARAAMADRTKSFFMIIASRGLSFSDVYRPAVKKKWQFDGVSKERIRGGFGR
jgi:hypothetical protein